MSDDNNAVGRLASASEWYAEQGWRILPCHGIREDARCTCGQPHAEPKDVGKHPRINAWNIEATSDASTVERWWREQPDGNIGVFCRPSGFLVIDIDPRSGGPESFEKFEELVEGALPPTVEAITGEYNVGGKIQRGRHLFYKCDPDEALVGNLQKSGLKGIDIKHNGYVLVAPSKHFSGVSYDWAPGRAPWQIRMAEAPEQLLTAIRKRTKRASSGSLGKLTGIGWTVLTLVGSALISSGCSKKVLTKARGRSISTVCLARWQTSFQYKQKLDVWLLRP